MGSNQNIGKVGENLASDFILEKGYEILDRNWRFGRNELDIIALYQGILVFIEVKTRTSKLYGEPEEAVNFKKEKSLRNASTRYAYSIHHKGDIRFDIISIYLGTQKEALEIYHIEDAFFPGL